MWNSFENYMLFWFAAGVLKFMVPIILALFFIILYLVIILYKDMKEQFQFRDGSAESRSLDQFILKEIEDNAHIADLQGLLILRYKQFFGHEHGIFESKPKDRRIRLMRARLASLVNQSLIFCDSDGKYKMTLNSLDK